MTVNSQTSTLELYGKWGYYNAGKLEVVNAFKNTVSTNDIFIAYRKADLKNKNIALFEKALLA